MNKKSIKFPDWVNKDNPDVYATNVMGGVTEQPNLNKDKRKKRKKKTGAKCR